MVKSLLLAAALGIAGAPAALAQTAQDPIAACRGLESEAARIACLEAQLRSLLEARGAQPLSPGDPPPAPAPAPPPVAPAPAATAPELGSEQVARREARTQPKAERAKQAKRTLAAGVRDFAFTSAGKLVVVLENGQVWMQNRDDVTRVHLREGERYRAEIKPGLLTGYRMRIPEVRLSFTAERVR